MEKVIFCIDLKSFFASVECAKRNLDPMVTNLVVADISHGPASIVLAVTPCLKEKGVPSRCRINELPKSLDIIYAKPMMQDYVDVSIKVIEIYLEYVAIEDIHIYSIDEVFIDFSKYLHLYKLTKYQLARKLQALIYKNTKIIATVGIGDSLFMAKMALDNQAKYDLKNHYIAQWNLKNKESTLWKVEQIKNMWGVGRNLEKRLHQLNIRSVFQLANFDIAILKKKFGIIGEELYYHANGIDNSIIAEKNKEIKAKSYSVGQTLLKDYTGKQILTIFKEMIDELCFRLRKENKLGKVFSLKIGYSYKDNQAGFAKRISLINYTNDEKILYNALLHLFNTNYNNQLIRRVHIALADLVDNDFYQFDLFIDQINHEKKINYHKVFDEIKQKYGKGKIMKASNLLEESTYKKRINQLGGHNAK